MKFRGLLVGLFGLGIGFGFVPWGLADEAADRVFVRAILEGDQDEIAAYLKGDPNPDARNRYGDTALIWAAYQGNLDLMRRLLQLGAKVELTGSYGKTALHWAAEKGGVAVIGVLLKAGADVNAEDEEGRTPLMAASRYGQKAAVQLLLNRGAAIDQRDRDGLSSLAYAVEHNREEVAQLLTKAGASLKLADKRGITPLALAVRLGRSNIFRSPGILAEKPDIEEQIEAQYITLPANLDEKPDIAWRQLRARIHQLVNEERAKHGRAPLHYNEDLQEIAQAHSQDMAGRRFFAHINLDKETPSDRAIRMGFDRIKRHPNGNMTMGVAENLYRGWLFSSSTLEARKETRYQTFVWCDLEELAQKAVEGWMNSPGHRENLLSESYDAEGIGIGTDDDHRIYITQNFF